MQQIPDTRRYDIDWLRTLAFILLIFYHIGMFYVVDWGWHVKSAYQSEFLQNIMLLVNQWRMPLIFLVSGAALALVEHKISALNLLKLRTARVFIPLIIGMYLIVPPQLYYQLIQNNGFTGNYLEFFSFYVDLDTIRYPEQQSPIGLLTWNHLWYLPYLFSYTLIYILLKPVFNKIDWQLFAINISPWTIFILPVSLFIIYAMFLEPHYPTTHALIGDWYNHANSLTSFIFGFLMAKSPSIWSIIIQKRKIWLGLAVVSYCLIIIRFNRVWEFDISYDEASSLTQILIQFIWRANSVLWLLLIIGFSGAYLNRKSRILSYMNEAVLPWYILHQTVIIVVAMNLAKYSLGGAIEPLLVTLLTFAVCLVSYEVIKRNNITRFVFGMKLQGNKHQTVLNEEGASTSSN